tara:strand:+ start:632 stop:856 length:225 start_codon:yes stop_codon:yes gene_type:complete
MKRKKVLVTGGAGFIGSPKSYSVLEIANLFNMPIEMLSERSGNRMTAVVITAKTEELGWVPTWSIEDYISKLVS